MNSIILVAPGINGRDNEGIRNTINALLAGRPDLTFSVITSGRGHTLPDNSENPRMEKLAWVPTRSPRELSNLGNFLAFWVQAPFLLLELIHGHRGRTVHFHCWLHLAALPAFSMAKLLGCRIVWTMYSPRAMSRPLFPARSWLLRLVNVIVVTDKVCIQYIPPNYRERAIVIPPCVDSERFCNASKMERSEAREHLGLTANSFVMAYVGHLLPGRGVSRIVTAHHELKSTLEHPVRTIIASSGIEHPKVRRELDNLCHKLGLGEELIRLGYVHKIEVIYRAADIVILPIEKFGAAITPPLTCIEAGMAGSIVLTSGFAGSLDEISKLLEDRIVVMRDLNDLTAEIHRIAGLVKQSNDASTNAEQLKERWRSVSLAPYDGVYDLSNSPGPGKA